MSELDPVKMPSGESVSPQERARVARESLIGKTVQGRYVLRSLLGHGGMGAVYEAEHLGIGKRVAIKFVDSEFISDEQVVTRFAREARAMSTIESPHIVSIFDAGTEDGRPYLVMELLRGEDLGQRLRRTTRVLLPEALHIIAMVLKGLAKAHAAGIVHRDLKPDNIFLVANDGDPVFAKIVDFGVSKIERPRNRTSPLALTGRGTVLGTPFYMSPEQAQAVPDLDGRADIYSVGAILFECLAGRPPHTGETYEQIILAICMTDAPDLQKVAPDVPAPVAAFAARALSRDRAQRFPSAETMLSALHELSPEEKRRVPLEALANKTMVAGSKPLHESAGNVTVGLPTSVKIKAAATQIGGSQAVQMTGPATPVRMNAPAVISPAMSSPVISPMASTPMQGSPPTVTAAIDMPIEPAGVPRHRPRTTLAITSVLAAILGVGLTFGIVGAMGKGTPPAGSSSSAPVASSAPALVVSASAPAHSAENPANSAASAAPSFWTALSNKPPAVPKPPPTPSAKASDAAHPAKPPGKGLDISRDLP